jgi:ABC-type polysaccharide/polyol phosphate export permease
MYQIALLAWMYLTPIFYPLEILAPRILWLIKFNPLYYILECFRAPIYLGVLPETHIILGALSSALVALLLGNWLFARNSDEFSYYL